MGKFISLANEPTTIEGWKELTYVLDEKMERLSLEAQEADKNAEICENLMRNSAEGIAFAKATADADEKYRKFKMAEMKASYALLKWRDACYEEGNKNNA